MNYSLKKIGIAMVLALPCSTFANSPCSMDGQKVLFSLSCEVQYNDFPKNQETKEPITLNFCQSLVEVDNAEADTIDHSIKISDGRYLSLSGSSSRQKNSRIRRIGIALSEHSDSKKIDQALWSQRATTLQEISSKHFELSSSSGIYKDDEYGLTSRVSVTCTKK